MMTHDHCERPLSIVAWALGTRGFAKVGSARWLAEKKYKSWAVPRSAAAVKIDMSSNHLRSPKRLDHQTARSPKEADR